VSATASPATCSRCVLDTGVPTVTLDAEGVCSHCRLFDRVEKSFPTGEPARRRFEELIGQMKAAGRRSKYDCVMGFSGGTDSTYCLYVAKQAGLRPLAVHFDNGWVSPVARENMEKAVRKLGVDLKVVSTDWAVLRDLFRAGFKASVPDLCLPCLIGISSALYRAAVEFDVRYIVLGTSFRTEGMTPARWAYMDPKYFDVLMKRFSGRPGGAGTFNGVRLRNLAYYVGIKRIKTVQFPLYLDYQEMEIRRTLQEQLGWEYGGSHHFDCTYKPLVAYVHANKFGIDLRKVPQAALVRTGQVQRADSLAYFEKNPAGAKPEDFAAPLEKLGMTRAELDALMREPPKTFLDYPNLSSMLRPLTPLVKVLSRMNLLPETVYEKLVQMQ
jgi:N-acetyl sugar amidotransferase